VTIDVTVHQARRKALIVASDGSVILFGSQDQIELVGVVPMLEELIDKDYALIDRLTVEFDRGLNILTGETARGKSIIVGALGFPFGRKG
jgi:hypothetical protein